MKTELTHARIDAVDAMRGFALAGIVFAHMLEQYIAAPRPAEGWGVTPNLLDNIIMGVDNVFIVGKFFSIFSLLFGISFAIMMDKVAKKGGNFSGRFIWRLALLSVFGLIHSLVYRGDILLVYVTIGITLPLFYHMSTKWLWTISILLFLGLGRFVFFAIFGVASFLDYENSPTSPVVIAYIELLKTGSFMDVVRENIVHGFASKFDFQVGIFGRGYVTLGYFLVGIIIVRSGILHNLIEHKLKIKKIMWQALATAALFLVLTMVTFSQIPKPVNYETWFFALGFTFYDLMNIFVTIFIMCGFLLLYLRRPKGWLRGFSFYGKMALSSYILQSIFGAFIFYGWGLGLLGQMRDSYAFLLCFVIIFVQVRLCILWLSIYQYGPLEWLWRSATYFKMASFKRKNI